MALQGLQSHSNQLHLAFLILLEIQLKVNCFTSLRMRSLLGLFTANVVSFLNRHRIQMVECITASNILVVDGEKLTRFLREKISLMFSRRTLKMFHHFSTSVHVFFAISHLTNMCSSVSISSLHIGQRTECISTSLLAKFDLVGILWFTTLQLVILTFFGTNLFQLVVGGYETFR